MKNKIRIISFLLSIIFCLSAIAFGQERTGSIEGTVKDQNGAIVPNATIEVSGNAFTRTITSNEDGYFRVQQVPPGTYKVVISAGNFDKVTKNNVNVSLGNTSNVDTDLKASVGAVVNVTTEGTATIDTSASKIQTDLGAKRLEDLPKGTNFTTSMKAAAPVRTEPTAGGFQIDGASGSENSFVIDGQEVTNFRDGTINSSNNIPFQLIQEVQIKSNGFEAEFGGATGGVINVVTKRGANEFHGEISQQIETSKLYGRNRQVLDTSVSTLPTAANRYIQPQRDVFTNMYPSFFAGGSVVKDRLFYFVSASPQYSDITRPWTNAAGTTFNYRSKQKSDYDFVRLDGQISDKLQLSGTYLYNPRTTHGALPTFAQLAGGAPPEVDQFNLGGRDASQNFGFEGTYTPNQTWTFNARFGRGYLNEKTFNVAKQAWGYGIPAVTQYTCPSTTCSAGSAGFASVASNTFINKDISIRKTFDAAAGLFLNNFGGRHNFKFGYQYTHISNDVDISNVATGTLAFFIGPTQTTFDTAGNTRPTAAERTAGAIGYGTLTLIGTFGAASNTNNAIFVQDSWQISNRLTLNLGLRMEKEDVPSFRAGAPGINFSWTDKLAPRFGAAFDVLGNGKWKVFGSYGRFFDRFKFELPRGSFGGEVQDVYDFIVTNPNIFSYTRASAIAAAIRFQDQRTPSNIPSDNRVDPDIKPFQQAELTFGTAYDFGNGFILDSRYTHKNIIRAIDDIGYHNLQDSEEYFIGNPGEGVCAQPACGRYPIPGAVAVKAKRVFDAVETRVQKRFGTNISFDTSYTWSRLFGNYSGSASSDEAQRQANGIGRNSPAVSRYFDLPFIGFTADGKPDDGLLPTDRTHFLKFSGNYLFDWWGNKANTTSFNVFYQLASGTPVTTRARIAGVTGAIVSVRGDLGRLDSFSQTDVSMTHKYRFGKDNRFAVAFDVNVLNLLNQAGELSRRETITRSNVPPADIGCSGLPAGDTTLRCVTRAFFNGALTSAKVLAYANVAGDGNKDLRYNLPQAYQAPRGVRFGFRFIF